MIYPKPSAKSLPSNLARKSWRILKSWPTCLHLSPKLRNIWRTLMSTWSLMFARLRAQCLYTNLLARWCASSSSASSGTIVMSNSNPMISRKHACQMYSGTSAILTDLTVYIWSITRCKTHLSCRRNSRLAKLRPWKLTAKRSTMTWMWPHKNRSLSRMHRARFCI